MGVSFFMKKPAPSDAGLPRDAAASTVFEILHDVADRMNVRQLLIGDLHIKFLLKIHDELDNIQRISLEILDQSAIHRNGSGIQIQLADNDVAHFLKIHTMTSHSK